MDKNTHTTTTQFFIRGVIQYLYMANYNQTKKSLPRKFVDAIKDINIFSIKYKQKKSEKDLLKSLNNYVYYTKKLWIKYPPISLIIIGSIILINIFNCVSKDKVNAKRTSDI